MRDGNFKRLVLRDLRHKRCLCVNGLNMYIPADEFPAVVMQQGSRQKSRLAKDLETIAHAQYKPAVLRVLCYTLHNGRKPGNGAAAEIIAVRKSAGQNNVCV